jgi:cell division protein ZapA (FtsZ GTPase activity inhibitor)
VNRLSFPAIAILAAINLQGEVVQMMLKPKSIKKEDLVEYFDQLAEY